MLFSEIVGHNSLKNKLIDSANQGRISHTQLFFGPEGSENMSLAIAYAQYLSCNRHQASADPELHGDSCGECPSCKKFQKLAHPDLNFIFPVATTKQVKTKPRSADFIQHFREALLESRGYLSESEWYEKIGIENKQGRIGVDDVNEVIGLANKMPYESEYNIIIFWMAEKLYHAAAPKLLKILEEPPEKTLFFLISYNTDKLLPTILSRTQMVKVYRHSQEDMRFYLQRYFNLEGARLDHVLNLSEGNIKNVYRLLEEREQTHEQLALFRALMLAAYGNKIQEIKKLSAQLSTMGREKIKHFLKYGLRITELCLMYDLGRQELLRASRDEFGFIEKFSKFVHRDNAEEIMQELELAALHIERNGNPKIILTDFSLKMMMLFRKPKEKA